MMKILIIGILVALNNITEPTDQMVFCHKHDKWHQFRPNRDTVIIHPINGILFRCGHEYEGYDA
jgi:hypothetical protein